MIKKERCKAPGRPPPPDKQEALADWEIEETGWVRRMRKWGDEDETGE